MVRRDGLPAGLPHEPPDPARARGGRGAHGVHRLVRELPPGPAPLRRALPRPGPLTGRRHAHRAAAPGGVASGQHRLGARGRGRRRAGVEPLDGLAAVPPRDQLRRSRPGLRTGRGVSTCSSCRGSASCATSCWASWCSPWPARRSSTCCRGARRAVLRRALRRAPRGAPPPLASGGGGPAAAGRRNLARRLQPPGVSGRHHPGRDIRRRHRAAAGAPPAWRRRGGRCRAGGHAGLHAPAVAGARRVPALRRDLGRGPHLRHGVPAPGRHAERTGEGGAVHRAQHRGHAQGLCPEQRRGARAVGRRAALEGGYRGQRRHDRQRPALGPAAAARHLRADPGDPHVLRLRVGGRRPLRHQWPVPPGDALGPRAELGEPAVQVVDQRAPHVHARPRPHPRPGQRGDRGGPAGAVHQEPASRVVGRPGGDGAVDLLRRTLERPRVCRHQGARVPLPAGRRQRVPEATTGAAASRSVRSSAG